MDPAIMSFALVSAAQIGSSPTKKGNPPGCP